MSFDDLKICNELKFAINKMNTDLEKLSTNSKQCTLGRVIALLENIK